MLATALRRRAKTGYGLETAAEIKMLQAIHRLQAEQPVELIPTFLGAHHPASTEIARGLRGFARNEMLPPFLHSPLSLSTFLRRVLRRWRVHARSDPSHLDSSQGTGARVKIHVDVQAARRIAAGRRAGATSVDHFVTTPPDEVVP